MSYTIELNNERRDANFVSGNVKAHSAVVEVFSAMVQGKELSKYGKKADVAAKYITELNERAIAGDTHAEAELNEIRRFAMEPILLKEIKLLGVFGNYKNIGYGESCEVEVPVYANLPATIQAAGEDVKFPVIRKKRTPVATTTISGGHAVDYRKALLGDMSDENELLEQIRIQIRNKAARYVIETVYNAIKQATGVKYFAEDAGLTKTNVDKVLANVRRWGRPTVVGDYALVSQFNGFQGYEGVAPSVKGISEAVMKEIQETGLAGTYLGCVLKEIPNPYDVTTLNKDGDNYDTELPAGLGLVIPTGANSPIYTVTRGGLTSFTGNDVTTGEKISRFDLEVGAIVAPGKESTIGIIHDTNLDTLAD